MEERIIRAMRNPYTTILGHPTGRLLLARDGYQVDMGAIIEAAAEYRVVIELNASPYRLDIDWRHLKRARDKGVLISIDPDAHCGGRPRPSSSTASASREKDGSRRRRPQHEGGRRGACSSSRR